MLDIHDENSLVLMNRLKETYKNLDSMGLNEMHLKTNKVVFVIDLYLVLAGFRHSYILPYGKAIYKNKLDHNLTAEIMNLLGHYRNYFNKQGVETEFHLFYGTNSDSANELLDIPLLKRYDNEYTKYLDFVVNKRLYKTASVMAYGCYVHNASIITNNRHDYLTLAAWIISKRVNKSCVVLTLSGNKHWDVLSFMRSRIYKLKYFSNKEAQYGEIFKGLKKKYTFPVEYAEHVILALTLSEYVDANIKITKGKLLDYIEANYKSKKDYNDLWIGIIDNFKGDLPIDIVDNLYKIYSAINLQSSLERLNVDIQQNNHGILENINTSLLSIYDEETAFNLNTTHYGDLVDLRKLE